jgi:hypothetical protein
MAGKEERSRFWLSTVVQGNAGKADQTTRRTGTMFRGPPLPGPNNNDRDAATSRHASFTASNDGRTGLVVAPDDVRGV